MGYYPGRTLVQGNLVTGNGGSGMHAFQSKRVDVVNNTSYHNSQVLTNNYGELWANQSDDVRFYNNIMDAVPGRPLNPVVSSTSIFFFFNLYQIGAGDVVQSVGNGGAGNITTSNPIFVSPATPGGGDFRLTTNSPARNLGVLAAMTPTLDILGYPRFTDGALDAGAYERQPIILTSPTSVTTNSGANIALSVAALGDGLTYQWTRSGTNLPGQTAATLTLNSVTTADAGNYAAVVATSFDSITSSVATITVFALPGVTMSPSATNFTYGNNATLTAIATGTAPLSYQWFDMATNVIPGATSSNLTLTVPTVAASGNYSVIVTNAYGSATNAVAATVNPAPLGITANDTNKVFNGVAFSDGNGVTYFGFVNSETPAVLGGTLNYGGTSQGATNVGAYSIVPSGLTAANYVISYTNGTLTITPAGTSVGASSSLNPSGFRDFIFFTATLPTDATGDVQFSSTFGPISTNTVGGITTSSLSITNLPRGTNIITVIYSGGGNYLGSTNSLNQIVTNHPPVANPNSYARSGSTWSFPVTSLQTNASDVDGDTLTLTVGVSTNGITLVIDGGNVLYTNASLVSDEFTYTVTDGFGGTNSAVITLTAPLTPTSPTIEPPYVDGLNQLVLRVLTQSGFDYVLLNTMDLNPPILWSPVVTNSGTGGTITNTIPVSPVPAQRFFRYQIQ